MLSERELDTLKVEAQERVEEAMQLFYTNFYGDRNYGIQSETGRQLGEPGENEPRDTGIESWD